MRIKKITEIKAKTVYAIGTSSHTFIADGLAHHNCYACNMLYNGQPSTFAVRLEAEKRGTVKRLEKKRHEIRQWTIEELKNEIKRYE